MAQQRVIPGTWIFTNTTAGNKDIQVDYEVFTLAANASFETMITKMGLYNDSHVSVLPTPPQPRTIIGNTGQPSAEPVMVVDQTYTAIPRGKK